MAAEGAPYGLFADYPRRSVWGCYIMGGTARLRPGGGRRQAPDQRLEAAGFGDPALQIGLQVRELAAGGAEESAQTGAEMLPRGEAEGEEEGPEAEAPPEPGPRAGGGPAAKQRGEDLPGQGGEERQPDGDGGADAIRHTPRASLE